LTLATKKITGGLSQRSSPTENLCLHSDLLFTMSRSITRNRTGRFHDPALHQVTQFKPNGVPCRSRDEVTVCDNYRDGGHEMPAGVRLQR